MKLKVTFLVASLTVAYTAPSQAELGDYSVWDSAKHLLWPAKPDSPVTKAQQNRATYPLKTNPPNFNGAFDPKKYLAWQKVELDPASTGAMCGNGSNYKFFVNRVPSTSNTIIYMEGGGSCWDYNGCTGKTEGLGTRNPNGIPDDYLSIIGLEVGGASTGLASPFTFRLHPSERLKTQAWNMVYIPYCTGDVYSGDSTRIYTNPENKDESVVWHHNGIKNTHAVIAWLKNNLPKPGQMLTTGCSAGGIGSVSNYFPYRSDINPKRSFMLADSGPLFPAPNSHLSTSSAQQQKKYPSLPLHQTIRENWGLNEGLVPYLDKNLKKLNPKNLGSLNKALAKKFPKDRLGHLVFQEDLIYSDYSYREYYKEIENAGSEEEKNKLLLKRWTKDIAKMKRGLEGLDNFGYFFPTHRALNKSHCGAIVDFQHTDIQEQGLEFKHFVNNIMNYNGGRVMEAMENDPTADHEREMPWAHKIIDKFL